MTPDTPEFTLANLTQPAGPAPGAPKRRLGLVIALSAAGAALIATVAVLATLLATSNGAAPTSRTTAATTPSSTSASTITIDGYLQLGLSQFTWKSVDDPTCYGINGFDDLRGGTPVTVTDAAGKALTVGSLDTGHAFGINGDHADSCRLTFSIPKVPAGRGPYGLTVSHRNAGHYNESDLAGDIELTV